MRVGIDGLPIGKENDNKQCQDGSRDRNNKVDAGQTQGNQQRESGLRSVSRGA
jgi:hypothetical protein